MLIDQGLPSDRVIAGPAVRQSFPDIVEDYSEKRNSLLFALSLDPESVIEMVDHISTLSDWIKSELKIPVLIKPHPISSKKSIIEQLGFESLPRGWNYWDGEIHEALSRSRCAITLSTAAIIDVVLSGCIPISLTRELNVDWNCLDLLEDRFDILKPVGKDQLKERLKEIFFTNRQYYETQTSTIRSCLLEGLNPVTEDNMRVFCQ